MLLLLDQKKAVEPDDADCRRDAPEKSRNAVSPPPPEMMDGERQQDPAEELKRADNGRDPGQPSLSEL